MLQSSFEKHVQSHVVLPPVARGLVVEDSLQVEHVGAPVLVCEHAAGPALKEMGDGVAQCVAVIVHAICHIRAYDEVEGPLGKLLAAEEQPLHADARTALREQQPLVLLRVVLQLLEKLVRSAVCEQDTRRAEAGCVEAADPRPCAELEDARAAHGGGVCPKPSDHRATPAPHFPPKAARGVLVEGERLARGERRKHGLRTRAPVGPRAHRRAWRQLEGPDLCIVLRGDLIDAPVLPRLLERRRGGGRQEDAHAARPARVQPA
mmetsp:Transcript_37654/g.91649  ORF Transcript_37654/g.91649 Transcript_37654/m.91649 type:complete len:263 (-) Transcript_37654:54-842(-)